MIKQLNFNRYAAIAGRVILSAAAALLLVIDPLAATEAPRTGTLIPGAEGSSMVQEMGVLRQSDLPRISNPKAKRRAANEAHDTLRQFASCIVDGAEAKSEKRDLLAFLRTSLEDPAVKGRTNKILRENCLSNTGADSALLRFSPDLLRGAIFRQLYLDVASGSPTPISRDDLFSPELPNVAGSITANQRFGACIVDADLQAADGFIRAKVASTQQDASLRDVMAKMSGCLSKGSTLQISRVVLDGILAEALYRKITTSGHPKDAERSKVAHQ